MVIAETYSVEAYLKATGADQFARNFKDATKHVDGLERSTGRAGITIGKLMAAVGVTYALAQGFRMVRDSVQTAFKRIDTFERFDRVMTTVTGSAEEANKALQRTNDIVVGTAYTLDGAASAVQNFVTRGMSVDKATKYVEAFGDAVAFYGDGSQAQFNSVSDALAKMVTKGKVEMDQLNRLFDAGIDAVGMYAKATNQNAAEVQNMLSNGVISAEEFIDTVSSAMMEGTNGVVKIAGAAKDAGATWGATFANMRAAVARGVANIITSIDNMLRESGLDDMRTMVAKFGKRFEQSLNNVANNIPKAVEAVREFRRALEPWMPIIKPLTIAIATFTLSMAALNTVVGASSAVWRGFNALLRVNPIVLIISSVIALAVVIYKYWGPITDAFTKLNDRLGNVVGRIQELARSVKSKAVEVFSKSIEKLSGFFGNLSASGGNIKDTFLSLISPIKTVGLMLLGITGPISWLISGMAFLGTQTSFFSDMIKVFKGEMDFGDAISNTAKMATSFIENLSEMAVKAIGIGTEIILKLIDGIARNLPLLIASGVGIMTMLIDSFAKALPDIVNAGIEIITTLLNTIIGNLPLVMGVAITIIETLVNSFTQLMPIIMETGLQLLMTIIDTIIGALPLIIETAITIIMTLVGAFIEALPFLIEVAIVLITTLVDAFLMNIPIIIDAGIQILFALIEGILTILPALLDAAIQIIVALAETIIDNLPTIIDAGIQVLFALIDGIVAVLPQLIQAGINLVIQLITAIIKNLPKIFSAGAKIVWELIKGIGSIFGNVLSIGFDLVKKVIGGIFSGFGNLLSAGKELASRVISGVKGMFGNVLSIGKELAMRAWNGVKDRLNKFKEAGANIAGSIADGVKGAVNKVKDAVSNITSRIRSFLPFSPAKEGPLKDIHRLDFGGPILQSIKRATRSVQEGLQNMLAIPDVDTSIGSQIAGLNSSINGSMEVNHINQSDGRVVALLEKIANSNQVIVLDTGELVGATYKEYDRVGGSQLELTERWGR